MTRPYIPPHQAQRLQNTKRAIERVLELAAERLTDIEFNVTEGMSPKEKMLIEQDAEAIEHIRREYALLDSLPEKHLDLGIRKIAGPERRDPSPWSCPYGDV